MEILIPKFNIDISGRVRLQVLDQRGRTKNEQHFTNAIHDDLKNAFVNHIASSSGATAFHINTSSSWFSSEHAIGTGLDGIFIVAPSSSEDPISYESGGNNYYDMKLPDNKSTTYGGGNSCTWQAEGTWTGSGGGSSASVTSMQIGNSFSASGGGNQTFATTFATATSSGDFSAFTLDQNDIARVTWTITIS